MDSSSSDTDNTDIDSDYETCTLNTNSCALPFDPTSLEDIILKISDRFNFRVILSDERTKGALIVTTGLTLAGGLIGKHYGGKVGAALGGALGSACGLGLVVVAMREVWQEIKEKLSELFDIAYDYLAGLGLEDYKRAALFLTRNNGSSTQLALLLLESASKILGKQILSSITAT